MPVAVTIRPPVIVDRALRLAARQRGVRKQELMEMLLYVIVRDDLVKAVLDDDIGGKPWTESMTTNLPT